MTRFAAPACLLTLALATLAGHATAQPAGASSIITGVSGLYIDLSIQTRRDLCSARFKDTQPAWRERTATWQARNEATLAELRGLAAKHEGGPGTDAATAAAATVVRQFKLMAVLAPATNLAPLVDEQAAWVCRQWLSDLEPAGTVDATLPRLLDAARKLQATPR